MPFVNTFIEINRFFNAAVLSTVMEVFFDQIFWWKRKQHGLSENYNLYSSEGSEKVIQVMKQENNI